MRRARRGLFIPAATAIAVAVAAALVVSGHRAGPTVSQAARPGLERATMSTPRTDPGDRARLSLSTADVRFPTYLSTLGWAATGARRDRIAGRSVTTVFYRAQDGTRIGYAVVSGPPLAAPEGPVTTAGGVRYAFGSVDSAKLITWNLDGHTCLIIGRRTGDETLLQLARSDGPSAAARVRSVRQG